MSPPLTLFFFLHISTAPIFSCLLNGKISGKCVEKSALKSEVSFCYKYLPAYVCVPELHEIWGDWRNATVDFIIEETIIKNLKEEFMFELSENIYSLPLINNIGCMDSYLKFLCLKNFQPCEINGDKTKVLCKSVCMNFFDKCGTWDNLCGDYEEEECYKWEKL